MLLSQDKATHALAGAAVSVVFASAALACGLPLVSTAAIGAVAAIAAGGGKELYDLAHCDAHTPDARDFAATVAGGLLVTLPLAFAGVR